MGRLSTVVEDPRLCCPDCGTDHTGHHHWYTVELTELTLEGRKKVPVQQEIRRCNNPSCARQTFVVHAAQTGVGGHYTAASQRYCVEKVTKSGLSYTRTVEEIHRETGVVLSLSVLYDWVKVATSLPEPGSDAEEAQDSGSAPEASPETASDDAEKKGS